MPERQPAASGRVLGMVAAAAAHLLTASAAALGLYALVAIGSGRFGTALIALAAAMVVDGIDGPLARLARVDRTLPAIDGATLDNLVDYLNYVIAPAYLIHQAGLLPPALAFFATASICVTSALQFSHVEAKTADHSFTGFPSYWSVVAFYLLLLAPGTRLALGVVLALAALAFLPVRYVHPTRTLTLRPLTLLLTVSWAGTLVTALALHPAAPRTLVLVSLAYPVYYAALSVALTVRGRGGSRFS